jgi:methylated-DNA-[protein]-cysteine S-methyltransferase
VFLGLMDTHAFKIIRTAIGAFGVVWSDAGIARTWMHDRTIEATRAEILRAFPRAVERAPTPDVAAAIDDVAVLLAGASRSFDVRLDTRSIPPFDRRVYEVARTIRPGETMTYGAVAKALGAEPMRARDVGIALARNPFAPIVPCHRIVAAGAQLGGYSAPGGASTKRRLLALEGAAIVAPPAQAALYD